MCNQILFVHTILGCDTTSCFLWIGQKIGTEETDELCSVLQASYSIQSLWEDDQKDHHWVKEWKWH